MHLKGKLFIAGAALAFISGISTQYFYPGQVYTLSDVIFILAGAFVLFWWYVLDAREKNFKRNPFLDVIVIALSIVGLPYYFFRTRTIVRALLATIALILVMFGWGVLGVLGQHTTYALLQS